MAAGGGMTTGSAATGSPISILAGGTGALSPMSEPRIERSNRCNRSLGSRPRSSIRIRRAER